MKKIFLIIIILFFGFYFFRSVILAQTETSQEPFKEESLQATVIDILEEKEISVIDKNQLFQKLELVVTYGSQKGRKIIIESGNIPMANLPKYQKGD
jgi:hypothetical protein